MMWHDTMARMNVIAHGVDLVDVARIEHMLAEHGERFVERVFTDQERAYSESGRYSAERYAARFACKEAVFKALGTGWRSGMRWRDVEIRREPSGQPRLVVTGRSAEIASALRIDRWHVSLSHTRSSAIASVIACSRASA